MNTQLVENNFYKKVECFTMHSEERRLRKSYGLKKISKKKYASVSGNS